MNDREPTETLLDRLIEEYIIRLADGEAPSFEAAQAQLPEGDVRRRFRVEATAEEYVLRRGRSEMVSLQELLERLTDDEEREGVRSYLEDGRRAGRFLPRPLAVGEQLSGKYRIVRELGRGGTAIVYEAEDETLDRKIAVKVFNPDSGTTSAEHWEETILRESQILASLSSRNIVDVIAAERDGEHSYVAMDHVDGRDLHEVLVALRGYRDSIEGQRTHLSDRLRLIVGEDLSGDFEPIIDDRSWCRTVARIMCRAANAVQKAHERGVLHRDLKPKNLILVPGGEPVLLDFGLASVFGRDRDLEEEGFFGTIEYLAPEQARDMRTGRDPRTDVYQLGLILYELLTLRAAFSCREGEPVSGALARKRVGEFVPPRELDPRTPRALDAICRHALAPGVGERYRSAGELSLDLARFERGLPPRFAPMPSARKAISWSAYLLRKPAIAVSLLAAGILIAVLIANRRSWIAPHLDYPFAVGMSGQDFQPLAQGDVLAREDGFMLGVALQVHSSTVLYAFMIDGGDTSATQVLTPVTPEPLPLGGEPPGDIPGPIRLEPSEEQQLVVCSFVLDPEYTHEGLLFFACEREYEFMGYWQEELRKKVIRAENMRTYTYERALELGERLSESGARGLSGSEISAEQRRHWFSSSLEVSGTKDDWSELGFFRAEFVFPLNEVNPRD